MQIGTQEKNSGFFRLWLAWTGAFLFAVITLILLHEVGHYLAFRLRGYETVSIRINPFSGMTSSVQAIQEKDATFIVLGGTIFNLSIAAITALLVNKRGSPFLLPLKVYAMMAFLIEGVVIVAGLFFDQQVTDFSWLVFLGWPPVIVSIIGASLMLIGGYLTHRAWSQTGFPQTHSYSQLWLLNIAYCVYLLFGVVIGFRFIPLESAFLKNFMGASLVIHYSFLVILILTAPRFLPPLTKKNPQDQPSFSMAAAAVNVTAGITACIFSLVYLN